MRNRRPFSVLSWVSLFFVLSAVILVTTQLVRFSRLWANFPQGLTIAGIPVGGLNRQQAAQRLLEAYSLPIELHYNEAVIQVSPSVFGYELDMETMLAAADQERIRQPFWGAFWNFLWGRTPPPVNIPLRVTSSDERIRTFLVQEVAARYDQPPLPATPIAGTISFKPGTQGIALDVERSIQLINNALRSPSQRVVNLTLQRTSPSRPAFQNLEVLLKQTISLSNFDGVIGLYMADMQSGQEISFISRQGEEIKTPPDLAFTASSTIKIPIMISVFRRLGDKPKAETLKNLDDMIGKSINPAADWLMKNVIDYAKGPLIVSDDMQSLGLLNTFLAGYFFQDAPILKVYKTPSNQRTDITTEPDPYSQTTPSEIGMLLGDIYQCSQGGGTLIALLPGEITQSKCQTMINYLIKDRIALLIQAGVPDGTKVAHKHGWVTDIYGVIHDMSDTAIIYTPGGDYVLAVFLYHPTQLVFDPSNKLVADLSRAIYNYYNLPSQ